MPEAVHRPAKLTTTKTRTTAEGPDTIPPDGKCVAHVNNIDSSLPRIYLILDTCDECDAQSVICLDWIQCKAIPP
jgi:hypothetical protein